MEEIKSLLSDSVKNDSNGKTRYEGGPEVNSLNNDYILKKEHLTLLTGTMLLGILANILFFKKELGISIPVFVVVS